MSIENKITSTIKKAELYQRAYNICMANLNTLLEKHTEIFHKITNDYAISITPMGIWMGGKEMTSEELHKFIDSKRPEYESNA